MTEKPPRFFRKLIFGRLKEKLTPAKLVVTILAWSGHRIQDSCKAFPNVIGLPGLHLKVLK